MSHFIEFNKEALAEILKPRAGEIRIGEVISLEPSSNTIYEIIGIPESIGVRANFGIGGTETAWPAFLKSFLNMQSNRFLGGNEIYLSGYFSFSDFAHTSIEELRKEVEKVDLEVSSKIYESVSAGRVPIIIGGGHNNAYGNLKGSSQALGMPLSVINFDAHADFRKLEGRHSGNGFSYAMSEGYLENYSVFGLKKSYVSEYMLQEFDNNTKIQVQYFDELLSQDLQTAVRSALSHTSVMPMGIEVDLDAVENILSSAASPVGFSVSQLFQFIKEVKTASNLTYIHICEGASKLHDGREYQGIGKFIAELVAEIVRK